MNTLKRGDFVPCHITQGAPIMLGAKVIDISESMAAIEIEMKSTALQVKYGVENDKPVFKLSATLSSSCLKQKVLRHEATEVRLQSFFGWNVFASCHGTTTLRVFLLKESNQTT